jgi:hypothetical protein
VGADAEVRGKAHNVLDTAPCEAKEDFNPLTPNGLSYQCTPLNLSHMIPPKLFSDVRLCSPLLCCLFPTPGWNSQHATASRGVLKVSCSGW